MLSAGRTLCSKSQLDSSHRYPSFAPHEYVREVCSLLGSTSCKRLERLHGCMHRDSAYCSHLNSSKSLSGLSDCGSRERASAKRLSLQVYRQCHVLNSCSKYSGPSSSMFATRTWCSQHSCNCRVVRIDSDCTLIQIGVKLRSSPYDCKCMSRVA